MVEIYMYLQGAQGVDWILKHDRMQELTFCMNKTIANVNGSYSFDGK